MNQSLKILLEGEGFRQVSNNSCEFRKIHEQSEARKYAFRVWLHKSGGQAEVSLSGNRVARLELWRSMDELSAFFKDFQ
jgi:hypothetical protein